jgi:hypothetical protein
MLNKEQSMSKFTKKISSVFNKKANDVLNSDAIPSVGTGSILGALGAGGGAVAIMMAAGAATIPLGIGFPVLAAGFITGAITGKHLHDKQKQKKGPKPAQ